MKILIASDLHGSREASEKLVSLDQKYKFSKIIIKMIKPRIYSYPRITSYEYFINSSIKTNK